MQQTPISPQTTEIGFIGTGVMGAAMAEHLLDAGYPLKLYTRTKSKAGDLIRRGAQWCETASELASSCRVVFTILGYPADVEEVYFGETGLLAGMTPGTVLVDMTTSCPDLAVRIADAASDRQGYALDAPVSGGDTGARAGSLSIMVGGEREALDRVRPLLVLMGGDIVHQGPAGAGQHCKMCNQLAIAGTMLGVCESMAYAQRSGLDPEQVLESISTGAAGSWTLSHLAPRMLAGDFDPGFYVKHFVKDMSIAAESAHRMHIDTPGLDLALRLYKKLMEMDCGNDGTQALFKLYQP